MLALDELGYSPYISISILTGPIPNKERVLSEIESFYQQLSPIIAKYSDNLAEFADGTQASKTSIWRWMNKVNTNFPDPNKVLSVLAKDSGRKKVKDIAFFYKGDVEVFLRKSFSHAFEEVYDLDLEEEVTHKLTDFYSYVVFSLCGTERGASEEEIIRVIGNISVKKAGVSREYITKEIINSHGIIAVKIINDLYKMKLVTVDNKGFYQRTKKHLDIDIDTAQKFVPEMIQSFLKPEEFSQGYNSFFGYTESIKPEVANKIAKKTKAFYLECLNLMKNAMDKDGVPFTIVNFAERLWFDELETKEGGLLQ